MKAVFIAMALGAATTACSTTARSPQAYRDDTAVLLEMKREAIQSCYDGVLKKKPGAEGLAFIHFKVAEVSGRFEGFAVDRSRTTAPPEAVECVTQAIDGLVLVPSDPREGQATFVWQFRAPRGVASAAPIRR
jgi:hypothetical protein